MISGEFVAEQKFHRPIEPDMRQRKRFVILGHLRQRRSKLQKSELRFIFVQRQRVTAKGELRVAGQFSGKDRAFRNAVKDVVADALSRERRSDNCRQFFPPHDARSPLAWREQRQAR